MSLCSKCGNTIAEGSSFCASCGAPAINNEPPVYQAPPLAYQTPPVYGAYPAFSQPMADSGRNTFLNSYLFMVVFAVFLTAAIILGLTATPLFSDPRNLGMILAQGIFLYGPIAFAAAVSTRAKGPDLSIGPVMALSSSVIATISMSSGSPILGIILSLLVCAAIGIFNGVIITYLRVPAVIMTLVTGFIVRGIHNTLLDGMTLPADESIASIARSYNGEIALGGFVILIITFIAAFLMIMLTKLGVPTYKRDKKPALSYMFAYMVSALMALAAGLYMMSRLRSASPIMGSGYEPFILAVFACVIGSRAMDNRFAPAVFAILPVFLYAILTNVLSIRGADVFLQMIIQGAVAIAIFVFAFISRRFSSSYGDD